MAEAPGALRLGLLAALGLIAGGWLAGRGFVDARTVDRFVTVKGVAERTVQADVGLWPLSFVVGDDDLARAQNEIEADRRTVMRFLARHGIDSSMTELQSLEVMDTRTNPYGGSQISSRFIITMTLIARSNEPARMRDMSQRVSELVDAGVVLTGGGRGPFGSGPTFLFTRLNDLKPTMIAEATANARVAADQFAKDSRSRLGGIRRANQGVFEILPRDQAPGIMEGQQVDKTLRVVSTVEYLLKN